MDRETQPKQTAILIKSYSALDGAQKCVVGELRFSSEAGTFRRSGVRAGAYGGRVASESATY